MADKEKKLRKILLNLNLKGKLKPAKTLEEAQIIIVQKPNNPGINTFFSKLGYQSALENGVTFPEERVYFTVSSNPRNTKQIVESILTKDSPTLVTPK